METLNAPCLLILDLPPSAFAGIDLLSFTATPRFQGIKHLPPGFHFVFVGTTTSFSERHGLWFHTPDQSPPEGLSLFVTRWNTATETLDAVTDKADILRWRANLGSIWREGLAPYRQSTSQGTFAEEDTNDWPGLTSCITANMLSRVTEGDTFHWHLTSASSAKRDLEDIPGLSNDDINELQADKELHFLPVDLKQTWREGATGRERTEAAQDWSWALGNLVEQHCAGHDIGEIIGELQFCFLMVLTINNFSCLEQWRRVLTLIFTCREAVAAQSDFFVEAIAALRLQLQHCKDAEGGLIDLADESGSLLKRLLSRFRKGLQRLDAVGIQDVVDELDDLEEFLRQEHGWQFGGTFARSGVLELEDGEQVRLETTTFDEEDETGEFAPQVVELTAEQAKLLHADSSSSGQQIDTNRRDIYYSQRGLHKSAREETVEDLESSGSDSEEEEMGNLEDLDSRF